MTDKTHPSQTNPETANGPIIKVKGDIIKALKKFGNKNTMEVAKILDLKTSLTFGALREETGLEPNILNHTLLEMKNSHLIISEDRQYYLTKYCVVLLNALNSLRTDIEGMDGLGGPVRKK